MIEITGSQGLKRYQYVQFDGGTAPITAVAGATACWTSATWLGYRVTTDLSDTKANLAAGVLLAVLTDEYYGWVQTRGYNSSLLTNGDNDIASGDQVWVVGDGTLDSTAAGTAPTYRPVAVAAADDAASRVAAYIILD
jgi:hypothetical protein